MKVEETSERHQAGFLNTSLPNSPSTAEATLCLIFHRASNRGARLILDIWEPDAIVAGLDGTRLLDRGKCSLTNWVR
jgi:hypothetical protein